MSSKPNLKLPKRLWSLARKLLDRPEDLSQTLDDASHKAEETRGKIQNAWAELKTFIRLIRAWAKKEYTEVPKKTLVKALFAILYFILIVDAVPDFIPVAGFLDDASVILWIASSIREDLKRFRLWETSRNSDQNTEEK